MLQQHWHDYDTITQGAIKKMLSAKWRAECQNVLAIMQSITPVKHAALHQESCQCQLLAVSLFVPCFSFTPVCLPAVYVCDCVSGSLCLFSQTTTSLPPTIPHVSADKRWGITKHVGRMLAEITRTGLPANISQEGRKGGIHHSDRARMERDIPPLSPHTCTVRDL